MLTLKQRSDKLWHLANMFHCHDPITVLLFFDQREYPTVPGICTNPDCMHISFEVDKREEAGHCPTCETETVSSVLAFAGVVKME